MTGIDENTTDEIVTVVNIYNMRGQKLDTLDLNALANGVYILQGLTNDGRLVSCKVVLNRR